MIDRKSFKKLLTEQKYVKLLYPQLSVFHNKSHALIKITPTWHCSLFDSTVDPNFWAMQGKMKCCPKWKYTTTTFKTVLQPFVRDCFVAAPKKGTSFPQ